MVRAILPLSALVAVACPLMGAGLGWRLYRGSIHATARIVGLRLRNFQGVSQPLWIQLSIR